MILLIKLCVLATIGAIIHLLFKYNNSRKRSGISFNWKRQIISTCIGLLTVWTLIYVRNDFASVLPINNITAVFMGYLGDTMFKNLLKQFKSKLTSNE